MSKRDNRLYLEDILECINKIENYTSNFTYEEFIKDSKTVDATVRNLEIIGEAVSKINESIKKKYSDIPWAEIIGFRNKVIHGYFTIDLEIVWEIVSHDLKELKPKIEYILKAEDNL